MVNWYLEEIEEDIENTEELVDKKTLVEKIIERLVHHVDKKLICISYSKVTCFYRMVYYYLWLENKMKLEKNMKMEIHIL